MKTKQPEINPGKAPFVVIATALAAGIALQKALSAPLLPLLLTVLAAAGGLLLFSRNRAWPDWLQIALAALLFCGMGMWRYHAWERQNLRHPHLQHLPLSVSQITGTVESVSGGRRSKAVVRLQGMQSGDQQADIGGRALVYLPDDLQFRLLPGYVMQLGDVTLNKLPAPRNPGQFDYGSYLRSRGISAMCRVRSPAQISLLTPPGGFSLENHIFYPLRIELCGFIDRHFPPVNAGILKALLLGVRDDIHPEIREDFQNAGVIHVLAISGLHVGFVALFIHFLLLRLPLYFKIRNMLTAILLLGYMLLTGSNPPVVRATTMAVIFLVGLNLERRGSMPNYLFAAAALILIFQPQQLFWIGFQFSFAAVASIIYFLPKLELLFKPLYDRIDSERVKTHLRKWIILPYCVSFAAQIGVVPLTMFYFQKFSLISFVINPPVILAIGGIVAGGFIFLILNTLSVWAAGLVAVPLSALLSALTGSVHWTANITGAYFNITQFDIISVIAYILAVLLLFNLGDLPRRWIFASGFAGILSLNLLLSVVPRCLDVLVLDVGQGDAALLRTPAGHTLLIDAGPATPDWSAADLAIIPAMQHLGVSHLRGVFISHPHFDHYGGIFRLLQNATIDTVYLPPLPVVEPPVDSLLTALEAAGIPRRTLQRGDVLSPDAQTRIYVLGPDSALVNYSEPTGKNVNNASLVFRVQHAGQTLLFTGDVEAEAEARLREWGKLLKCDVLKIAHHGSGTSSTPGFLSIAKPRYAVISAGKYNRFGHPDSTIIRRLGAINAQVLRTDLQGAAWLRYHRGEWQIVDWK